MFYPSEAVMQPSMRFVADKPEQQQSGLMLHRSRQLLVSQRTMLSNAIRGHLAEFGVIGQGSQWHSRAARDPRQRAGRPQYKAACSTPTAASGPHKNRLPPGSSPGQCFFWSCSTLPSSRPTMRAGSPATPSMWTAAQSSERWRRSTTATLVNGNLLVAEHTALSLKPAWTGEDTAPRRE